MSKKFLTLISVVLIFTMIVTACSSGTGTPKEETIKIGWIGSLTGDQAVWGTCESNTVKMLIEEVNASGGILGKQVEGIYYDTKGDAAEAVNATKRLASQDKVVAIIGPNASGQAIAISSVLEEYKVPDISTVGTNPKVTVNDDGSVKEFNFRVCFIDPYQGAVAAGYAYDRLGLRNAAVLYDVASDYSQGFTEFFEKTFIEKGGKIVAKEGFKEGDVEFKPQLSKIKDANPDMILMPYYYKEVALSANQARELGIDAVLIGGDGWPSEQLMTMAADAIEGSYIVNHLDFNDPEVKPLQEKYTAKYNLPMELNGYMAHDAFLLLKAAIEDAGVADPVKIAESLTKVTVQGVTGTIKLSPEDHNPIGKEAAIVRVENADYIFQEKYGLQ
ncbi:MAG TPA: ABC transporter substrate-binding protein [Sedimentibacter sp.]|nr:ABC transporter substrate-binding protein [Sedimentibacter sp.]HPB79435.1 ABC transporter substrate-binding protein [Sedimentibacter sp.]HPY55997.1 ABC transporter substrate-binding protein [Sedimentibacter sp.]HQC69742.1 ABC transporter substrate-binding protein [Sedimentibacter sp.]HQK54302.1 ABC transporter substrate-binding protein [Sedimentibacter sp.]